MDKKKILGLFAALGAVAGWAISFVSIEALQKDFSSQEILFLQYLTPVFGVLFAALFLGEQVTPAMLIGGAVILAGVIISNKGK